MQRSFGIDGAASHGLAAAQDLGDDVLLDLIRSDDPVGMLSIYIDGAAAAAYGVRRSDSGNRLVELERSAAAPLRRPSCRRDGASCRRACLVRILIAGDRRLTRPLIDALPNRLRQSAGLDSRHLTEVDGPALEIAVAERLASERAERHLALARRIRDAALGTGRGAPGLSGVLAALNDARVEHLIYDPAIRYTGALGEDDVLLHSPEAVGVVVQKSRLTERLVERCLLTAARITPLDATAATTLADAGGIAALLRW